MKKLKNSLELPNPTRNTRKFANKLMTDTSGELLDLQSKQDIICHGSESETSNVSALCGWRNTFLSVQIQRVDKARKMYFTHSKENVRLPSRFLSASSP